MGPEKVGFDLSQIPLESVPPSIDAGGIAR